MLTRCPNCIDPYCDAFDDDELCELADVEMARRVARVDRAVTRYQRKRRGELPFTDFQALLPESVRKGRAA